MTDREPIFLGAAILRSGGKLTPAEALVESEVMLQGVDEARTVEGHATATLIAQDERAKIEQALELAGWNVGEAAEALGMKRQTLFYRMRAFGIPTKRQARKSVAA